MHLSIFISVFNQLDAQNLFHNKFYFMPLHVSSTCAHHQEVKITLHSLWYVWWYLMLCNAILTSWWWSRARNMQSHEIKLIVKQILWIKLVKYWNKSQQCVLYEQNAIFFDTMLHCYRSMLTVKRMNRAMGTKKVRCLCISQEVIWRKWRYITTHSSNLGSRWCGSEW